MCSCPKGPGLVVSRTAAYRSPPTVNSTFKGCPYPYSLAAPDAFDSLIGIIAVTATGMRNRPERYRSSRSLVISGIVAPPANPAGTFPGFIRVQEYSPTFFPQGCDRKGTPEIADRKIRRRLEVDMFHKGRSAGCKLAESSV